MKERSAKSCSLKKYKVFVKNRNSNEFKDLILQCKSQNKRSCSLI